MLYNLVEERYFRRGIGSPNRATRPVALLIPINRNFLFLIPISEKEDQVIFPKTSEFHTNSKALLLFPLAFGLR